MSTARLCLVVFYACILGAGKPVKAVEKASGADAMQVTAGPSLPSGRGSHAGGLVNGHAVVAGGTAWSADKTTKQFLSDCFVFGNGTWTAGPALPNAIAEPAFAYDQSGLYVAGGRRSAAESNDAVYRLSESEGKLRWNELPKLPVKLTAGTGAILDGQFYAACGSTNDAPTNHMWSLDVKGAKATWQQRKPLPGPQRMYPALVACGPYLYLFGGMRPGKSGMEVFSDAYRYDPKADAWQQLADLPARGYCWAGSAIDDHTILLAGRADGVIHDELWRVSVNDMRVQSGGRQLVQATCAPLVRIAPNTWWLIGGEPDSSKTRTEKVTVIQSADAAP